MWLLLLVSVAVVADDDAALELLQGWPSAELAKFRRRLGFLWTEK
jgi:hypothetical protein